MLRNHKFLLSSALSFSLALAIGAPGVSAQGESDGSAFVNAYSVLSSKLQLGVSIPGKNAERLSDIKRFYGAIGNKPAWLSVNGWTPRGEKVIELLRNAAYEGLNPEDYDYALRQVDVANNTPEGLANAEIALTCALLEYIDAVYGERLNPQAIKKTMYLKPVQCDAAKVLIDSFAQDSQGDWVVNLTFPTPEYQDLKKVLAYYIKANENGGLPELDRRGLVQGASGENVEALRQILAIHGDLDASLADGDSYDADVEAAVRSFQKRHREEVTGTVTPTTYNELVRPLDSRIRQIAVTMEKWRWRPVDMGVRYINVNVASQQLRAYDSGKLVLKSKIIIGRNARQTPVMTTKTTEVRFNPSWSVPPGIATNDKLPQIKKNPGYLKDMGMQLYNANGERVNPSAVDWSQVSARSFNSNYRIVQPPGADNALGKIRFSLDNPFNVYMHSTPSVELFNEDVRSFSSGCIRVEKADELGHYLLNDESKWPLTKVRQEMRGNATKNIPVSSVPVHVTYHTVWRGDDGRIYFSKDIYSQDQLVWNALKKAKGV